VETRAKKDMYIQKQKYFILSVTVANSPVETRAKKDMYIKK
jgi:hypothetical protein